MVRVLFVCLGNICRSPMAKGIFDSLANQEGLAGSIMSDSAGTIGYHTGAKADHRTQEVLTKNNISLKHSARQVRDSDFREFDYIIAMDASVLNDLRRIAPSDSNARLKLMRHWDPENLNADVEDPYYGGPEGFERSYEILLRSCRNLLDEIKTEGN